MSNRTWRIIGTGLSFSIFGIVGAILSIALIPIVLITPASELRQKTGKRLVKLCFQAFLKIMQFLGVMSLKTEHLERLKSGGRLVLANHPSLIDVVILIALVNNPDGVIKTPLLYNPFTLGLLRFAGFIRNEEGPELIVKSIRSVESGNNFLDPSEDQNEQIKLRAIGRKRNGFGKALGDMLLKEGETVQSLTNQSIQQAFTEKGYTVLSSKDQVTKDTYIVDANIQKFWAWMNPGFWQITLSSEISTDLAIKAPKGATSQQISVKAADGYQVATEANWTEIIQKSIQLYINDLKSKLN